MPAGKHGHKMRELEPPPPPISEEHAALRERIVEEWKAIEWDYSQCAHTNDGSPLPTPESLDHAHNAMKLMRKEEKLLAEHGVDYRPYQVYVLS